MELNRLSPNKGAHKNRKRVGRGVGSGFGKTAGRGYKGQNSRSGGGVRPGFEGGQMPIHRRLPKRGFTNIFRKKIVAVNISQLAAFFEKGSVIGEKELVAAGLVSGKKDGIKLLANGEIDFPLTIKIDKASKEAIRKIESAGGSVEIG